MNVESQTHPAELDLPPVQLAVRTSGGWFVGTPMSVCDARITVDFDGATGPRLMLGARILVEVRLPGAEAPIAMGARVEGRAVSVARLRYVVEIDQRGRDDIPTLVASALALGRAPSRHFERGMAATVRGPGGALVADVRGLSPAGICLAVAPPHARDLVVGDHAGVTLDIDGVFTVEGRVVRIDGVGAVVLVAVGFVPADVDPVARTSIARYIERHLAVAL